MNWLMQKLFGRAFLTHECQQAEHEDCPGECRCCAMGCRCDCHKEPDGAPVPA